MNNIILRPIMSINLGLIGIVLDPSIIIFLFFFFGHSFFNTYPFLNPSVIIFSLLFFYSLFFQYLFILYDYFFLTCTFIFLFLLYLFSFFIGVHLVVGVILNVLLGNQTFKSTSSSSRLCKYSIYDASYSVTVIANLIETNIINCSTA